MASISKRVTASGEARYDVRYRAGGRAVEETFKRRQDAENRVRQVESEKLRGQVVDPRRGREKLADFAERWLEARTAKGKPLTPMTKQGYRGLLRRNIEQTIGQYALAETPWQPGSSKSTRRPNRGRRHHRIVNPLRRPLDWWRREPPLPSNEDLVAPVIDDELASEMTAAAELIAAGDDRLDYSPASVAVVADVITSWRCSGVVLHRYGAYVGEVLRRNSAGFAWAVAPRRPRTPGLALKKAITDPFEMVERYSRPRPHPEDTLPAAVEELLAYAAAPTEETATRLGWTTKMVTSTAWESMREDWRRWRRRWRRRQSNRI